MSQANTVTARDRIILALDTDTAASARKLIDELHDRVGAFKVGLQLISREGSSFVDSIVADGIPLFFDGKFHDIPNTVAHASEAIAERGVWMFDVHASGGARMMRAAVDACAETGKRKGCERSKVIAVTVLTSLGQDALSGELGIGCTVAEQVKRLALLAKDAGVDGVVASPAETSVLRQCCGPDFLIVTPGVRPAWAGADDQARVSRPFDAIANGADYLVVGRPITAAANRKDAASRIEEEIERALSGLPA